MSDLVHSGEFVPGYSSFLFNQLLHTQFNHGAHFNYSVNHGGLSINLNLTHPRLSSSIPPDHLNLPRAVLVEEHITCLPPHQSSGDLLLPQHNNVNTNKHINEHVHNSNNNNNINNNITTYKSIIFQQVIADQQTQYNRKFERDTTRGYVPSYPDIDLLEYFGERDILRRNKKRLQAMLYDTGCNIDMLKLQASKYVPNDMRPMTWQLLFNYLPLDKSKRESVLLEKQKKYVDMIAYATAQRSEELVAQIDMDVLRTLPEGHEIMFGNPAVKQALARVLLVWAVQHPATGYFQGLNDLASPFLYSFLSHHSTYQVGQPGFFYNNDEDEGEEEGDDEGDPRRHDGEYSPGLLQRVEADVYWCLCSVMESVEHLNANSKCGVHGEPMMVQLETLIRMINPTLDEHMRNERLEYVYFSFPWMLCLFVREVSLDLLLVLWDFYAAHPQGLRHAFSVMHVYVCAAFMLRFRNDILRLEFPEMLKFLHNPPTKEWTTQDIYDLIAHATALYNSYPLP